MSELVESSHSPLIDLIDVISANGGVIHESTAFMQQAEHTAEGFGVFVDSAVEANTELIKVPLQLCISSQSVQQEKALQQLFADNPGLCSYPDEVLALGLMYALLHDEKQKEQPIEQEAQGKDVTASNVAVTDLTVNRSSMVHIWSKHVRTMPMSFNSTIFWSESELQELRFNAVFHLTNMMKRQIEADFQSIHLPLSLAYPDILGGMTKEMYAWALSAVYSRSIEITKTVSSGSNDSNSSGSMATTQDVRVIVPLLDMANHYPQEGLHPADTFNYDEASDCISLRTHRPLSAMEECYAVYGMYCNAKLLFTYGFAVLNNPHRAIDLWTRVTAQTSAAEVKQALIQRHELTREQTFDFKGTIRPGYISPALLATIRVIQCTEEELPLIENAFRGRMVSTRNELASYVSLKSLVLGRMDAEKAQADKEQLGEMLLRDVSKADRLLCALIVRVEERELLQDTVALIDSWVQKLTALGDAYQPPDAATASAATATADSK